MRELLLTCLEEEAESLSDALLEAGALSVSVEDADENTEAEQALFGEPGMEPEICAWQRNRVVALIPDILHVPDLLDKMFVNGILDEKTIYWKVREVPDTDWVRLTQSQFGPILVGERILILPSWHKLYPQDIPTQEGRIQIELDPGLAFGTGSHATTHLCLEWLAQYVMAGDTLLDYGCGSGILGIAAKKLGAARVTGVDIDEQAVISTRYNAQANRVQLDACLPQDLPEGNFDLVVANILSNPLKVLAPMLVNRVRPGGYLILSGIFEWQATEMIATYAPLMPLQLWRQREGWGCMVGRRPLD